VSRFVILDFEPGEYAAEVGIVEGVEDDWELLRGVPRLATWPRNAAFRMDDNFPDDIQLEDVLRTGQGVIVASQRLVELLQARAALNNEFLPVQIINHKGRRVREAYWIVHQIQLQRCIDEESSVFDLNAINPELISDIERLVVDESRVPPEVRLFRMARYPFIPLVERSLADEIAGRFSGLRFDEIENFHT
jgi:Immunity protein family (Imm11)